MVAQGKFGRRSFQPLKVKIVTPTVTTTTTGQTGIPTDGSLDFSAPDQSGLLVLLLEDF